MVKWCQHYLFPSFPLTQTIWTWFFLTARSEHRAICICLSWFSFGTLNMQSTAVTEPWRNSTRASLCHMFCFCFFFVKSEIWSSNLRLEMDRSTFLEFSKTCINVFKAYLPLSPCFNTEMWSAHPLLPLARLDVYKCTLKLLVLDLTFAHGCEGTTNLGFLLF